MAKKEKKQVPLEASLWAACNKLRGSVAATDYVNVVLGLLFLRFAYDKYQIQREKLMENEDTKIFVDNPKFYSRDNVFYLGAKERWPYINAHSKKNDIYQIIDTAYTNMEKNNPALKGALPIGYYADLHIEPSKFSSLLDEINKMQYSLTQTDDVIGRVYEYFLRKFCIAAKSEKGEFYTPGNIVDLMTRIIQPYQGSVYDPCCGSGGMFVQSAKFVDAHQGNRKEITIYGQENSPKSYRLARMNLAIRGLSCDLGEENADSFLHDLHPKLLADYILANPPFNLKAWRTEKQLTEDDRWKGYATPPVGNANYAWILHMLSHLSYDGTAAFLLANGALNAGVEGEAEYEIRKKLIQDNKVEAIIVLPRDMFYATDISVTLWLCGNHKKAKKVRRNGTEVMLRNRENEILLIDAREMGDNGANDDGFTLLPEESKERIINTVFAWQSEDYRTYYHNIPEFCYSATIQEIKKKNYALSPSKYIKFVNSDNDIDYQKEMLSLQKELTQLSQKMKEGQFALAKAMEEIGYAIDKS